jgi:hypothetical protein
MQPALWKKIQREVRLVATTQEGCLRQVLFENRISRAITHYYENVLHTRPNVAYQLIAQGMFFCPL